MSREALLSCRGVTVRFGGIVALSDVSFDVPEETICGIIGPNGAGKTTLFNCLSRLYQPTQGSIIFNGVSLLDLPRHRTAELGLGRTFQNLALFKSMSVRENISVGAHSRMTTGFVSAGLRFSGAQRERTRIDSEVSGLIQTFELEKVADVTVSSLPFGTQKRVEFARAMALRPKLLLLDEPAAGLNHEEVNALRQLIISMRDTMKTAVLLIEHHMNFVMGLCDNVVVLEFGRKIAEGSPREVQNDPAVIHAYLGAA